jgi:hypothetical protein
MAIIVMTAGCASSASAAIIDDETMSVGEPAWEGGLDRCAQKQRAFLSEGPSWVARLAGFEPTTPWFVAKYSIQLSYSRTLKRKTVLR